MTREEAIKILEQRFDSSCRNNLFQNVEKLDYEDALWMAISALRSVSREQELETENKELKERIVNWRKYMAPTREQAEKAWRSEWKPFAESAYGKQYKCPNCHTRTSSCSNFCPHCGAPMSDEAVQMVMERLEVVCSEAKAD